MGQTLIEKIVQQHVMEHDVSVEVRSGDTVMIAPDYVMTHDNTGAVIPKFYSTGAKRLHNPDQVVITLDHNVQDKSEKNLTKYRRIEEFARNMGAHFFPAGRGIGHQIMCEEGFAFPGGLAVASDSHSNIYGGLGCVGTPVVRTDAAGIWATGKTWWQIPPVARIILKGKLPDGVYGKDLILALCSIFNQDEILNHALEFSGDGVKHLSIEERLTIANMTTEWGALVGLFPIDEITLNWLEERISFYEKKGEQHPRLNRKRLQQLQNDIPHSDEDAFYAKTITIDLSQIPPYVAGPHTVKNGRPIFEIEKEQIKIHKAYLLSCVNSRLSDLEAAARILKGKKIASGVEFYLAAASSEVQQRAEELGYWQDLLNAGAIPLPPGCGPCIGLGKGLLKPGEVGISATNRNFKGRMGSRKAEAYLASPAVVAYSALTGKITYPGKWSRKAISVTFKETNTRKGAEISLEILKGFPEIITGKVIFCPKDNINTDGIYPGKYTYIDDFTPEDQARVVMENYDPEFNNLVEKGDILVSGFNFGTGSSREQAATALKFRGIQCLIAGSFSETYRRNAINNGFIVIQAEDFVKDLKAKFGQEQLTIKTDLTITINFRKGLIQAGETSYRFTPPGRAAQTIIIAGGLENWIKNKLED